MHIFPATSPQTMSLIVILLFYMSIPGFLSKPPFCACCSERGTWYQGSEELYKERIDDLNELRFSKPTRLLTSGEGSRGIEWVDSTLPYKLKKLQNERHWRLVFTDVKGHAGTLVFNLPERITSFAVDLQDRKTSSGGGPLLYKEWRLEGPIRGTGIFRRGVTARTRYRLILQARGNACTPANDFKSWVLEVTGGGARFIFYGSFEKL